MKKSRKWLMGGLALVLAVLCCGAALAAAGGQDDPLVTLSYLEQTVLPDILKQVDTKAAAKQQELQKNLAAQIEQYRQQGGGGGTGSGGASYTLVTLTAGQTMKLEVGCELLLRVGSATVNARTSPALIDLSTGGTIESGTSLTKNHLYMSTIADRTLTPSAASVKLLVRGGYSVVS